MMNSKPKKLFGNTPGTPFNFDVNKDCNTGHTMIIGPVGSGKCKDVSDAYTAFGLSNAEMEIVKNGRL